MNFLDASDDYKIPSGNSSYLKLQDGETRLRILSRAIVGWEDWKDKKPIRFRHHDKPLTSIDPNTPIKHFWSMLVWNYQTEQIQIWHVTQATIQRALEGFAKNKVWGAPYLYDICVTKSGQDQKTKYQIVPEPHSPVEPHIRAAFKAKPCDLNLLFEGQDPWSCVALQATQGFFDAQNVSRLATDIQLAGLQEILEKCEPTFEEYLKVNIKKNYSVDTFADVTAEIMDKILARAKDNATKWQAKLLAEQQCGEVPF